MQINTNNSMIKQKKTNETALKQLKKQICIFHNYKTETEKSTKASFYVKN